MIMSLSLFDGKSFVLEGSGRRDSEHFSGSPHDGMPAVRVQQKKNCSRSRLTRAGGGAEYRPVGGIMVMPT